MQWLATSRPAYRSDFTNRSIPRWSSKTCSSVGTLMKVYGANDLGSTPGAISHSCQPLSCSAAARQNEAKGSGRGNMSLPHSRAKKPERMAWSVCRITNIGSFVCWTIMNAGRRPAKPRGTPLSSTRLGDSSITISWGYGQKAAIPSMIHFGGAGVAELADAVALGATGRKSLEVQILSPAPKSSRGGFALSKTEVLFSSSFFFPLCAPNLFCEPARGSPDRLIDFVLYFSPTAFGNSGIFAYRTRSAKSGR